MTSLRAAEKHRFFLPSNRREIAHRPADYNVIPFPHCSGHNSVGAEQMAIDIGRRQFTTVLSGSHTFPQVNRRRIFVMISTKSSLFYTRRALSSFFRWTDITKANRFILIANDHEINEFCDDPRLEVICNDAPKGFAANVNIALREALRTGADTVLLNNDIIFTDGWLSPLLQFQNAITLPMCNQNYVYQRDDLELKRFMDWDEFSGKFDVLEQIARSHRERFPENATQSDLLMPFFCIHLPNKILQEVGEFDESFGRGGAEDVDYRLRTLLAGYDVAYAAQSYVLHFMGKSTWRGAETASERAARERAYFNRFSGKWGNDASEIFLSTRTSQQRINELGLRGTSVAR
jgi:GT2 family glycosyltransferase